MTLEDALDKALRRVVLLVRALIKLVRALSSPTLAGRRSALLSSRRCLTFSLFGNGGELPTEDLVFLSLELSTELAHLDLILGEVDAIESDQRGEPDLELGAELIVLVVLAGEHWVKRILYQVQVLDLRVQLGDNDQSFVQVPHRVVRQRQSFQTGTWRERSQVADVVVVEHQHFEVREPV